MTKTDLDKIKAEIEAYDDYARRVLEGDTEYDGADGARDVREACSFAMYLAKELEEWIR